LQEDVAHDPVFRWIAFAELLVRRRETELAAAGAHLLHVRAGRQVEPLTSVLAVPLIIIQEYLDRRQLVEAGARALRDSCRRVLALRLVALYADLAESFGDKLVVGCWQDGVADASVDDGLARFDSTEIIVLSASVQEASTRHSKGPIVLCLVYIAPEYILLGEAGLCILGQIVAAESDTAILIRGFAQENTKHGLKGVLRAKLVNLGQLLHEALQVAVGAGGRQADDAGEAVAVDAGGLVRLEDLHVFDAWCLVSLLEANLCFVQESIYVTGSISVFDAAHQGFGEFGLHLLQLLGRLPLFNIKLLKLITVLGAFCCKYINYCRASIELDGDLLGWGPEINFTSVLLIVYILQRNVCYRAPLRLVLCLLLLLLHLLFLLRLLLQLSLAHLNLSFLLRFLLLRSLLRQLLLITRLRLLHLLLPGVVEYELLANDSGIHCCRLLVRRAK